MAKNDRDYSTTTSRYYYNRLRKKYLSDQGEICCGHCPYNRGENRNYRVYFMLNDELYNNISWKLASKNGSQWMGKRIRTRGVRRRGLGPAVRRVII